LVDMVVERPQFFKNMSWNLIDTMLVATAIWTLVAFRLYYRVRMSTFTAQQIYSR